MNKAAVPFLFLLSVFTVSLNAQTGNSTAHDLGSNHLASLNLYLPVGVFNESHITGFGLNYSWSHHRYGQNISAEELPGFTANAGGDYYLGKKINTAGHDFKYGNYLYLYVMPGLIVNPCSTGNISLFAGPSLGVYRENSDWGFSAMLTGNYYVAENISIGPGISYKKHTETRALWSLFLRGSYRF